MLLICINLLSGSTIAQNVTGEKEVLFTYGDFYPDKISDYEIIVLESAHFDSDDISILQTKNETILGYISLGEVNEAAAHFPRLKDKTLGKNNLWNSYVLDLEDKETSEVLMTIIEDNLTKGLDGMFLDNIDNFTQFGPTPEKTEFLIQFLQEVKSKFPEIILMQNAGISILEDTAPYIDIIAKESIATDYDFTFNKYQLRDQQVFESLLEELKLAHNEYDIPIILIEYADHEELKKKVKARTRETNWPVFIGKIDLQSVPAND